ncbi:4-hydroxy-2-oxoheptanedioate aldolase [Pseudomonas sp. UMC76]|uniref:4-hydroxy-2-oxoheptanedioate aldolase n=1 Tax=Pseudomonas sp. UMC76 TaxID=1862324 RepID=UPI00160263C0|nr:4-hydroxy-2-oxoheptanedioate aldolase [Pseudomonas sp. UMC76]MBB1605023.1 2,4-dihydroxyhept-2-ene-1,7-dioic acid aldolase [Pseudomonas sp. UMC76]
MPPPFNTFKQRLQSDEAQIGLWLGLADPYCAELAANAGFDWLLIDGEHAPNDLRSLLGQLQAVAPYPVQPIIRPVLGDTALIKQLLDIGAQTLLVPMVDSAEQARELVRAMRYPPFGVRGVGSALARASRWNSIPGYLDEADAQMCLLVQVENLEGLANLDAIAAVDGVDGVFIGPADLSAAMGQRGNPGHPEVQAAIEDAIARIQRAGKAAGILSADEKLARRYLELGAKFVAVGVDTSLLMRSLRELAGKFKARPSRFSTCTSRHICASASSR